MENYTFFDTYNIFHITTEEDTQFDIGLFAESLILNEKIFMNVNSPDKILYKLFNYCGEDLLIDVIQNEIVSFVYDFIPFRLLDIHQEKNKICKLILEDHNQDIEEAFTISLNKVLKKGRKFKKIKEIILDNIQITNFNAVDISKLNNFIIENINKNEVIYKILKANRPYHLFLEYWKDLKFEVEIKNQNLYLNIPKSEENNRKFIMSVIGGTFLPSIMTTYISIISAQVNNCNSLWGNKSTEALFEANYNVLSRKKEAKNFHTLLTIEECPNIANLVNLNKMNFKQIIKTRHKAEKLRCFLSNINTTDELKVVGQYLKELKEEDKVLESIPAKVIRFLVGCINPAIAATDTFIVPFLKKKTFKTIKISDILK